VDAPGVSTAAANSTPGAPSPIRGGPIPRPLDLAVAGCGVVGRAFLRAAAPSVRAGVLRVVAVSDSTGTLHDPAGLDPEAVAAAKESGGLAAAGRRLLPWRGADAARFLSADAVVDLAPGDLGAPSPDASPLAAALAAGRDAVTAAKAALALFPSEIEALRRRAGARLLASATVAGGVPVLELLAGALRGAGVEEVAGAWNATSTFVLARVEEGATREEALADARRLGFAEADASQDLDGRDAAAKACIVSAAAFGRRLRLDAVARAGLESLDADAVRAAARRGRRTRLVARVTPSGARVALETLPEDHPLAACAGEARVSIRSTLAGTVSLRGPGAGGPATASAVLHDCLALAAARRPQEV
jgi:homoserine dehydrogenase